MTEYVCPTCAHVHSGDRPEWYNGPEEWRPIPGFAGYEVSNHAAIRNKRGNVLRASLNMWGYRVLSPRADVGGPKQLFVHRAVALAFVPLVDGKTFVNHINGDKADNRPENLEWVNRHDNMVHAMEGGKAHAASNPNRGWKLSAEDVATIRRRYAEGETCRILSEEYKVNYTYLRRLVLLQKRAGG